VSTTSALFTLKKYEKYNWNNIITNPTTTQEKFTASQMLGDMQVNDVIHRCMIPMYNEDPHIVYETVEAIALSGYDLSRIAVTIQ
jgi:cellulose synthase/poly-beta-1,6-N-acetylglucosamine synthase-like glycosyltransferase